jgi:uncharacterized protein (TIGR00645 family)
MQILCDLGGGMERLDSLLLSESDIIDYKSLVDKLLYPKEPIHEFIIKQLLYVNKDSIQEINVVNESNEPKLIKETLVKYLNCILAGPCLYKDESFKNIQISLVLKSSINKKLSGISRIHRNRLLLSSVFVDDLEYMERSCIEEYFERSLFNCRFMILVAVLGSLVAAAMMLYKGCQEIVQGVNTFYPSMFQFKGTAADDNKIILAFIPAIDNYLFATVLLIFSMGIYELFVSEIDPIYRGPDTRPSWLTITNLDDLKSHIGKVIMMILIVYFFKQALSLTFSQPKDLIYLGGGITLIAISLYLTHQIHNDKSRDNAIHQ